MKKVWFFLLALLITLGAAVYQKMTGPTYPKKIKVTLNGKEYKFKLPRSCEGSNDCKVEINIPDRSVSGFIFYKRYKVNEEYTAVPLRREGDNLVGLLPGQPPAGKLEYYLEFDASEGKIIIPGDNAVVVRFKGVVPKTILLFHIFFMFFAMLWANYAGLLALSGKEGYFKAGVITLLLILVGGMILGPIVQKYAFGEFWAGIPYGWDLTDNKTLIAFVAWIVAIVFNRKKQKRWLIVVAALITIIIFSIPHSMYGSELNYQTGTIQQG
jgi:hypothetical protein